jgi:N-ethylmaleimide reductase
MTDDASLLFSPFRLGDLELKNRVVMAPLTRIRASEDTDAPNDLNAEYYRQRATAGLIITEASQISQQGQGYIHTPGIYTDAQVEGWKKVTQAVHAEGGRIFIQLWHVGRISHVSLQPGGGAPVAPSAISAKTKTFTATGYTDVSEPRALKSEEIPGIVADYLRAAESAKIAGFDGIEIHGANGYLIDQFLKDGANKRTDAYGGSIENRARFALANSDLSRPGIPI